MGEQIWFLIFYMAMAYVIGMISLIVGHELVLRKIFSNVNIIDINTPLNEMDLIEYLEFEYIKIGE